MIQTPQATDVITNFKVDVDKIDLAAIDADSTLAGMQDFSFIGTAAITGAGQLHVCHQGGNTYVAGNVDGNVATPEFLIELLGNDQRTANDFLL